MKRMILISGIIVMLFVSNFSFGTIADESNLANTIYVDDDNTAGPWDGSIEHPYQFIQDGIDNASDGDTVFVFNGVYDQIIPYGFVIGSGGAFVDKPLSLIGEDKNNTIIDAKGNNCVILYRNSTPVTIRNLMLFNGTSKNTLSGDGISKINYHYASDFDTIIINNCIFKDNNEGIHMLFGSNNVSNLSITNCEFINHRQHGIFISGDSKKNNLENVLISNCSMEQSYNTGIWIDSSYIISSNESADHLLSKNITISNCLLKENGFCLILNSQSLSEKYNRVYLK